MAVALRTGVLSVVMLVLALAIGREMLALGLATGNRLMAGLVLETGRPMAEGSTTRLATTMLTGVVAVFSEVAVRSMAGAVGLMPETAMVVSAINWMPTMELLMELFTREREMSFMITSVTGIDGDTSSEELGVAITTIMVVEAAEERFCDLWL